jgi:hypothetical protein
MELFGFLSIVFCHNYIRTWAWVLPHPVPLSKGEGTKPTQPELFRFFVCFNRITVIFTFNLVFRINPLPQ